MALNVAPANRRPLAALFFASVIVLLVLLAGHIALARRMNTADLLVTLAVTAFGGGCALLTASLVLDGFVTPSLALQYRAAQDPAVQHSIEGLVRFCGTSIRVLMPMGLLSFAASSLAWSVPLARAGGARRLVSAISAVLGVLMGLAMFVAPPRMFDHAVLAGLFLFVLWHVALAAGLLRGGDVLQS